jgi:hypothetical protein
MLLNDGVSDSGARAVRVSRVSSYIDRHLPFLFSSIFFFFFFLKLLLDELRVAGLWTSGPSTRVN